MNRSRALHGPELLDTGLRFRLWAPSADSVALLRDDAAPQPMTRDEAGWYRLDDAEAKAGSKYRFLINGALNVPDPASHFQPDDVDGPSEVIAPDYAWKDMGWKGRPWEEAVIYELHVGTFSPEGSYAGIEKKLDYLKELGVTAIELMPIAEFPGKRNWGYDGVLPYAPDAAYGRPEELKRMIDAAHARGIMVFLDVVYNHFGPLGNYLHEYAKQFFTEKYQTPWGAAIAFEGEHSDAVRHFFINNALYWLEEYHFDGLRFDAVHAIQDASKTHFLDAMAKTIRERFADRHIHLILENEHNQASRLERNGQKPRQFTAQWNDDFHHNCHVLLTKEEVGYYGDYQQDTLAHLARCLTQGFDYQGEVSQNLGKPRGEKSGHLPPGAFVIFLQNHDQIGNRACGDRLITLCEETALKLFYEILLLSPFPPMLFMGEEWGAKQPFTFFTDYHDELADAVREGRRKEFAKFPEFSDPEKREKIPDPNAVATFDMSRLDWTKQDESWLTLTRELLVLRREKIVPMLASGWQKAAHEILEGRGLKITWTFGESKLVLLANLSGTMLNATAEGTRIRGQDGTLAAWSAQWRIA